MRIGLRVMSILNHLTGTYRENRERPKLNELEADKLMPETKLKKKHSKEIKH